MKKLVTAVLGGIAVASVAFASASALTVNGGVIQAGQTTTLSCDDAVQVKWGLESKTGSVSYVRVFDIADECVGGKLYVKTNLMDNTLNATIVAAQANDNSTKVTFASPVLAKDLTSLDVIIER